SPSQPSFPTQPDLIPSRFLAVCPLFLKLQTGNKQSFLAKRQGFSTLSCLSDPAPSVRRVSAETRRISLARRTRWRRRLLPTNYRVTSCAFLVGARIPVPPDRPLWYEACSSSSPSSDPKSFSSRHGSGSTGGEVA